MTMCQNSKAKCIFKSAMFDFLVKRLILKPGYGFSSVMTSEVLKDFQNYSQCPNHEYNSKPLKYAYKCFLNFCSNRPVYHYGARNALCFSQGKKHYLEAAAEKYTV